MVSEWWVGVRVYALEAVLRVDGAPDARCRAARVAREALGVCEQVDKVCVAQRRLVPNIAEVLQRVVVVLPLLQLSMLRRTVCVCVCVCDALQSGINPTAMNLRDCALELVVGLVCVAIEDNVLQSDEKRVLLRSREAQARQPT